MADDPKLVKPEQLRAARGLLGWSQTQLAEAAGMSLPTVKRYETSGAPVSPEAVARLRSALEAAGIGFLEENGGGAGVRLNSQRGGM
jgi:transcriptional regulator with XRE-family HTH domain